jgi:hypothetical protein
VIRVRVALDAPNQALSAFGAGALVRIESAALEAGPFTEIGTRPVVAATYLYELDDGAGTATTWYRWRLSNAGNTATSDYSDPFLGFGWSAPFTTEGMPRAYATLDDLLATFRQRVDDTVRLARLNQTLIRATQQINSKLKFDFFPHPLTGTETRIYDGDGTDKLCVHEGIYTTAGLLVEISQDSGATFVTVSSGDLYAEPRNPASGQPYFHLRLTPLSAYRTFPRGRQTVRVTAGFGWAAVPEDVKEATIARARQLVAADPSLSGVVPLEEVGAFVSVNRLPDPMYQLLRDYSPLELGQACYV